jgi:hypothetical protein
MVWKKGKILIKHGVVIFFGDDVDVVLYSLRARRTSFNCC